MKVLQTAEGTGFDTQHRQHLLGGKRFSGSTFFSLSYRLKKSVIDSEFFDTPLRLKEVLLF